MSLIQSFLSYFHQHRALSLLVAVPLLSYSAYYIYTSTIHSTQTQTLAAFPKKSVRNDYILGKLLGKGSFSTVRIATHIRTQKQFAAKIINLRKLENPIIDLIYNEINILRQIQHANVITLHDYYVEPNFIYIILEYLPGGELFDVISKMQYSESDIKLITITLLKTLVYLHEHSIVHRDLKPENLLLSDVVSSSSISTTSNPLTHLKIADFGFAAMATIPLTSQCGTPEYAAPELLLNKPYSTPVDVWALGVVVYVLLVGYTPFAGRNYKELYDNIKHGNYSFDDPLWEPISDAAKDFIRHLLVVDPAERYTAQQALQHVWLTITSTCTAQMSGNRKQLRRYVLKKKFRAAVRVVVAIYRMKKALASFGHVSTP